MGEEEIKRKDWLITCTYMVLTMYQSNRYFQRLVRISSPKIETNHPATTVRGVYLLCMDTGGAE